MKNHNGRNVLEEYKQGGITYCFAAKEDDPKFREAAEVIKSFLEINNHIDEIPNDYNTFIKVSGMYWTETKGKTVYINLY